MARQLLWNGYPTDQRGSYFRQFWDVRGYVPRGGDPSDEKELREKLKDIPQVHRWGRSNRLGANRNRADIKPENLILLIRGDLIRRYPNALIYACEARWDAAQGKRALGTQESYPLFRGTLSPDVTFFGFALEAAQARGSTDPSKPQGWYFVFQELPSEARFGLDSPQPQAPTVTEWDQLSWSNFPATERFALARTQPSPIGTLTDPDKDYAWGSDSAQTAFITMRRPVRVAVHADTMVPAGGDLRCAGGPMRRPFSCRSGWRRAMWRKIPASRSGCASIPTRSRSTPTSLRSLTARSPPGRSTGRPSGTRAPSRRARRSGRPPGRPSPPRTGHSAGPGSPESSSPRT